MTDPGPILLLFFFLLLIGFYTTAETIYLRPAKFSFETSVKELSWSDKLTGWLLGHRLRLAAICVVGRLIALVGCGVILAAGVYEQLPKYVDASVYGIAILAVLTGALAIFFFRWLVPKLFLGIFGQRLLAPFAIPLVVSYYLFYPLVQFVTGFNRFVTGRVARVSYQKERPLLRPPTSMNICAAPPKPKKPKKWPISIRGSWKMLWNSGR
jgi:CBS domain containing-hemolysin-like protein